MTNSKVILTTIKQNLYIEVNLNMSSAKRRSFCLCSMAKEQPVAPPYQFRAKVTLYNSSWTNGGRVTNMHDTKLDHLWSWWLFVSGRHQAITIVPVYNGIYRFSCYLTSTDLEGDIGLTMSACSATHHAFEFSARLQTNWWLWAFTGLINFWSRSAQVLLFPGLWSVDHFALIGTK